MKMKIAAFALIAAIGLTACGGDDSGKNNTATALLLLAMTPKMGPLTVGTWAAPASGSATLGACAWLNVGGNGVQDVCVTKYPEGACYTLGASTDPKATMRFSTSSGATSTSTTNNLCTQNGFTSCVYSSGYDYTMCGPNNIASTAFDAALKLFRAQ